jgi:DNA-binding response OmpR family regulator
VHGLRLGADYYLTKPVNLVELTATIDSLFSRMNRFSDNSSKISSLWLLEPALRQLVAPDGQSVRLTASELGFLSAVMQQAGKLVTRPAIIEAMGENPADYDLCRMDTLVRRLRLKIKERLAPLPLETVHGQGYIFTA